MIIALALAAALQTQTIVPAPASYSPRWAAIHDRYIVLEQAYHCAAFGHTPDLDAIEAYAEQTARQANADNVNAQMYQAIVDEAERMYLRYTRALYAGQDAAAVDATLSAKCPEVYAQIAR